jgi:predicted ester cyclase
MSSSAEVVARRLIEEGFNQGDLTTADELTAASLVEHQDYGPLHAGGAQGVKAVIASLRAAYPDFRLTIEDLVASGDTVWLRMTATGTNDGSFMGHAPTGRRISIDVVDIIRVEDGRMVEHWGVPDRLGALFQLGLAQPPTASPPGRAGRASSPSATPSR